MLTVVAGLALIALGLAASVGPYPLRRALIQLVGDKLEWKSRSLAGPHAVNCGEVERGHSAAAANDCVRDSLALAKAFRVRYGVQTIDADISTGLVRSPQGRLYEITIQIDRGSLFRQRTISQECVTDLQVTVGGRLTCLPDRGF